MRGLARARLPFDLDLHPRVRLLADVREVLFSTSKDEADHLAEVVLHWSGLDRGGVHGDRPMTENEVGRLAASGLVEIGAHTVTHRPLDRVSQTETHVELSRSRAVLRDIVGKNVATFAYPYGRFGPQTPRLVAEAGFSAACTTQEFLDIGAGGDPFLFPRITVRDCDGDAFSRMLRDFVGP
jgi:peptidoglycan/xylan/chitin deacetylase (PgdA/CDA1 family)